MKHVVFHSVATHACMLHDGHIMMVLNWNHIFHRHKWFQIQQSNNGHHEHIEVVMNPPQLMSWGLSSSVQLLGRTNDFCQYNNITWISSKWGMNRARSFLWLMRVARPGKVSVLWLHHHNLTLLLQTWAPHAVVATGQPTSASSDNSTQSRVVEEAWEASVPCTKKVDTTPISYSIYILCIRISSYPGWADYKTNIVSGDHDFWTPLK